GRPSTGGPASYVILHGGGSLPPGLARHVEAAGGAITGALPQIGVTFATSGATDFATRASWIPGVGAVAQDTLVRWVYASGRVVPLAARGRRARERPALLPHAAGAPARLRTRHVGCPPAGPAPPGGGALRGT